jgi:hypothetical protein
MHLFCNYMQLVIYCLQLQLVAFVTIFCKKIRIRSYL